MYLGKFIEEGEPERLFHGPHHPDAKGLRTAVSSVDPERRGTRGR